MLLNHLFRAFATHRFNTSHTCRNGRFRYDFEKSDLTGGLYMRSSTKLLRKGVIEGNDTNKFTICLPTYCSSAGVNSLSIRYVSLFLKQNVLPDLRVDLFL